MAVAEAVEQRADTFIQSPHKLLIDGEWVEAASGRTFESSTRPPGRCSPRSPRATPRTSTAR